MRVDWIRATFAVWKRPQVTGGVPCSRVHDIGYDIDSVVGVGGQPDTFVVGRVIGLLDREVSPKYGWSVGFARLFWAVWGFGMRRCRFAGFVWFVC